MNHIGSILALSVLFCTVYTSYSQDVIIRNDKSELKAKVIEITEEALKYKRWEMLDGPLYTIAKKEVFMIVYENGTRETFPDKELDSGGSPTAKVGEANSHVSPVIPAKTSFGTQTSQRIPYDAILVRTALNDQFNAFDLEMDLRFARVKHTIFGAGVNVTVPFEGQYSSLFFYGVINQGISFTPTGSDGQIPKRHLYLWVNAGGTATSGVDETGAEWETPMTFLWEVGIDVPLGKRQNFGVTLYTPRFSGAFVGIYFSFLKL